MRTLQRDWERPQLVTRVTTTFNGNTIRDYQYAYDILGRITNRIDNGVQMNEFTYNPRSEVLTALFGTNETAYVYDDIGNHDLYPANNLNQYATPSIAYDADGNMTQCGIRTFGWDAENRLVSADDGTTNIVNAYDYKHRRVRKNDTTYFYDVWNLISETTSAGVRHYFWGLDLSDSLQGAGGVGGLLAVSQGGSMYYPVCDNNGNVTAYLDDFGNTVAAYEYNAFGETISQSGSMANGFAFRFSTKYYDGETELYYYGYRFYSSTLRTWLNRDPIEEEGGLNLYGFCGNDVVNLWDNFGLTCSWSVGRCKRPLEVMFVPQSVTFHGIQIEVPVFVRNSINQVLAAHHNVKVQSFSKSGLKGDVKEKLERGFFAKNFNEAIRNYILSLVPKLKVSGYVDGFVAEDKLETQCVMNEVSKERFDLLKTRITTNLNKQYHLVKYNCQIWADEQLR